VQLVSVQQHKSRERVSVTSPCLINEFELVVLQRMLIVKGCHGHMLRANPAGMHRGLTLAVNMHDHPPHLSQLRPGCARSRARLSNLLDGTLTRQQRIGLWTHVAMCFACGRVLRNFTTVVQTLRTLDDGDANPRYEFDSSVKARSRAGEMAERWRRDAG